MSNGNTTTTVTRTPAAVVADSAVVLDCGSLEANDFETIQSFAFWVEGVAMTVLGCLALVTNSICIYGFTRKELRNSFNSLIVALTIVDSFFCLFVMADYGFARAFQLHTVLYHLMYPHFLYPATNIALAASIFFTVSLGLERYVAVCFPLVHRDLAYTYSVSMRVAAYAVPVVVLSVAVNIPKFLETRVVIERTQDPHTGQNVTNYSFDVTELRDNPVYIKFYMNLALTVILGIAPFVALIFFNIKIYLRFLQTRGRYARGGGNSNSTQAKDLQLGMILVCVVCMFFVTNVPRVLLNLYELFHVDYSIECGDDFRPPVWLMCMSSVNHLLLVLNCIMNFVVYCCFNSGFKKVVCGRFGCVGSASGSAGALDGGGGGGGHDQNNGTKHPPPPPPPTTNTVARGNNVMTKVSQRAVDYFATFTNYSQ